ncbi:hypothetical protein Tsubulata_039985 [Turnera subulata]|uniref:Hsp70-interacting protein N-terminal domain-containing protein n=1 Tax=Turnera subulata TaxID=218843 RepID=A0A9Q0JB00_9ROSI|nr:hypothetical protein Tsubulata_039985 [Turnera subulata]
MEAAKLEVLRQFVETCKADPSILTNDPSYAFFREGLESLGVQFPLLASSSIAPSKPKSTVETEKKPEEEEEEGKEEVVESNVGVEGEVVEPDDNDPTEKMGDLRAKVTEEDGEASREAKAKPTEAVCQGRGTLCHLSLASSADTGSSSSSSATSGAASRSEVMVLGQPQPFTGHNIFEKGERSKYTQVKLPGLFKKRMKLWVNYSEMYLSVEEVKVGTATNTRNVNERLTNLFYKCNGILFELKILIAEEKEKPSAHSSVESALYTKVELPGIYGKAVKLWVKSGSVLLIGEEFKILRAAYHFKVYPDYNSLIMSFVPQSKE